MEQVRLDAFQRRVVAAIDSEHSSAQQKYQDEKNLIRDLLKEVQRLSAEVAALKQAQRERDSFKAERYQVYYRNGQGYLGHRLLA